MKKLMLGGLGAVAALGAAALAGGKIVAAEPATVEKPKEKPKRKPAKKKQRAKVAPSYFTTRGKYIPGGEYRNCGERGISPKLLTRNHV